MCLYDLFVLGEELTFFLKHAEQLYAFRHQTLWHERWMVSMCSCVKAIWDSEWILSLYNGNNVSEIVSVILKSEHIIFILVFSVYFSPCHELDRKAKSLTLASHVSLTMNFKTSWIKREWGQTWIFLVLPLQCRSEERSTASVTSGTRRWGQGHVLSSRTLSVDLLLLSTGGGGAASWHGRRGCGGVGERRARMTAWASVGRGRWRVRKPRRPFPLLGDLSAMDRGGSQA